MTAVAAGRVLRSIRGHFWVEVDGEMAHASARESLTRNTPRRSVIVIGDLVDITWIDSGAREARITRVHPRRSQLSRRVNSRGMGSTACEVVVAANVDAAVIVSSSKRPALDADLIDRYLVAAAQGDLEPILCINKIDLEQEQAAHVGERYRGLGYSVVYTCAKTGEGLPHLTELMRTKISVLAGHSGVGKTSLLKWLVPGIQVKTGEVSERSGLGRHTTTTPELTALPDGGYVIDTPGIRHFTLWQATSQEVRAAFVEIHQFGRECRFKDCAHKNEPDCAVLRALARGQVSPERYQSYLQLERECSAERLLMEHG